MAEVRLTGEQARRIAVRAQLLDSPRPTQLVEVVQQLTLLQLDPTAAVAPSADLVAWSRLGSTYEPAQLKRALEQDRSLVELNALIRPMEDLPLYLADADDIPRYPDSRAWFEGNARFRHDILARLEAEGPLQSKDVPDTSDVPWPSTGWTNNRNVTQMLEFLVARGEVAIAGRQGRQRIWDLASRVYPSDLPRVTPAEAKRLRDARRLRALGIARATGTAMPGEPPFVGEAGVAAVVDGVAGEWRVDPDQLERIEDELHGRTALLSPFDRLSHDRKRALELFDFDYTLEMYKPAAQRRWGYFALPVLHGDRLVGKVDSKVDRKAKVLRVEAIHEDVRFTRAVTAGVMAELEDLAAWLGVGLDGPGLPSRS
ncbi:MAG TPA: crosslink repair DNA glycosylase YcaQ family protein [Intrasporangium sp.]|uniref:DNA glycosylase AlkZ-like family protein n=1 Tax=Intrasporangium sp. TaxID=1925024 RepID=UPI002B45F25D|nr:crosslink repair DNA glycosylase YcaQ family protein [Intrasporangium sp.]HKX66331.1 crosslink repair DNA glycosylase YcaQ family protein [Intrasporangium sp.]